MFSFLRFGSSPPKVESQDINAESVSLSALGKKATGGMEDGVSVEQVASGQRLSLDGDGTWKDVSERTSASLKKMEPLGFNLETLHAFPEHFEITGDHEGKILCNNIHKDAHDQVPFSLQRAYRAAKRTQTEKDAYLRGMMNVRKLLIDKYDQNAVDRFDKHFAYRISVKKPLTVRALEAFLDEEDNLRSGTVNVSNIGAGLTTKSKLEELKIALQPRGLRDQRLIIGGGKTEKAYQVSFFSIRSSWFESAANAEDVRKGDAAGISEARAIILGLIPNPTTQKHVEHLFNCHFAAKIEKKETLTVKELSTFIDAAIQIRDSENGMLGGLYSAARTAKDNGKDVGTAVYGFLKSTYHALGLAAGAAVVLDQERNTNDPIMGLIKGLAAGTLVATEDDTERILTLAAEHLIPAAAPASQTSITSSVLKFFTFGIY